MQKRFRHVRDRFHAYIGSDAKLMNILYQVRTGFATRFLFNRIKGLPAG